MMKKSCFAAIISIIVFLPCLANASYISLSSSFERFNISESGIAYANFTIRNYGDEPANNVNIRLLLPEGFSSKQIEAGKIGVNGIYHGSFEVKAVSKITGSYTAAMLVEYEDSNGYGLSAITPAEFSFLESAESSVSGFIESSDIIEKGSANMAVKLFNNDKAAHSISIRIFLPNELSAESRQLLETIEPLGQKTAYIKVSNKKGLVGSSYPVFASIDYADEKHYSSYASGFVSIKKMDYSNLIIFAIIILSAVLAAVNVKDRLKK